MGFSKLFDTLVTSTVWREPDHVRIVWITMLALSNKNDVILGSIPGIADMARVTLEDCKKALEVLSSPDEYSRSKEFEGRRICEVDGGWLLLNREKYSKAIDDEALREYYRAKKAEYRAKKKLSKTNAKCPPMSIHVDVDVDVDKNIKPLAQQVERKSFLTASLKNGFDLFWKEYPRRVSKGAAEKAWASLKPDEPLVQIILEAVRRARETEQWKKESGQFIPYPATWLRAKGWEDEIKEKKKEQHGSWDIKL